MEDIDVSVIVVIDTDAERIPVLLLHLEQQTFPASRMEVLIADAAHQESIWTSVQNYGEGAPIRTRAIRARSPGVVASLNASLREARGRVALFIDQDVLPSPRMVERHHDAIRVQRHATVSVGRLEPHPQLPANALTAWFMSRATQEASSDEPLHYSDWRRANLAVERERALAAGGFDEAYATPEFADADLAYRLSKAGYTAWPNTKAVAYIAYRSDFATESERHFAKGRGMRVLHGRSQDAELLRRYPIHQGIVRRIRDAMFIPFYVRACMKAEDDIHILGHVYRRVFTWQRARGWRSGSARQDRL